MVRLILTLTPCVCFAAAIALSNVLESFLKESNEPKASKSANKSISLSLKAMLIGPLALILVIFGWHCAQVTSSSYSSPSVVLAYNDARGNQVIIDDFREAYYWLRQNVFYY